MSNLRLSWWRCRSWRHGQIVLFAALCVAVSGVVCVASMVSSVETTLQREARAMLGADIVADSNEDLRGEIQETIRSTLPNNSKEVLIRSTRTMLRFKKRARQVQLESLPLGFPFAGTLRIEDANGQRIDNPNTVLHEQNAVFVQPDLLALIGADIGDHIGIGSIDLIIAGLIKERPGQSAFSAISGPLVYISPENLDASGLVGFGARLRYRIMLGLADSTQGDLVADSLRAALGIPQDDRNQRFQDPRGVDNGVAIRTAQESSAQLQRSLGRLADFLHVSVLVAVLIAGVGICVLVQGSLHTGRQEIASLRLLGAGPTRTRNILLGQYAFVAIFAGITGVILGSLFSAFLLILAKPWLPIALDPSWSWNAAFIGCALALVLSLSTCWAAISGWAKRPAAALARGDVRIDWPAYILSLGVGFAALITYGAWQARSWILSSGVIFGAAIAELLLWLLALGILAILRRSIAAGHKPGGWRRAIHTATRPERRGSIIIAASGLAAALLGLVAIYESSLNQRLQNTGGSRIDPGLFVIDVQNEQINPIQDWLKKDYPWSTDNGAVFSPYLRARLRKINEQGPPDESENSQEGERRDWAWYREHNLSTRTELSPDETIIKGAWPAPAEITNWCSLSENMADLLNAEIGDTIAFEAQGVPIEVVVTSVRHVEWSFYPNFFVLINPDLLDGAPLTWIGAIPTETRDDRLAIQLQLAETWPNVSAYDVHEISETVNELLARILTVIRGMGLFTLGAGIVVIVGLALGSLAERQREAVILRALGARRGLLQKELVREYTLLGLLAGIGGIFIALLLSYALLPTIFEIAVAVPFMELALIAIAVCIIVVCAAYFALRRVYAVSSAQVLRDLVDA